MDREEFVLKFKLIWISLFGCLLFLSVARSVWIDEVSMLLNFPLDRLSDIFSPLPLAQQAAPPLFNLIVNFCSGLPVWVLRSVMGVLVLGGIGLTLRWLTPERPQASLVGLIGLGAFPFFLRMSTEIKHYGLEAVGASFCAAWLLRRSPTEPLSWRDGAVLGVVLLTGPSALILVTAGLASLALLRLTQAGMRSLARLGDLPWLVIIGGMALASYLQTSYASAIQTGSFPDAYDVSGLGALIRFLAAIVTSTLPFGLPLAGLTLGVLVVIRRHDPRAARLLILLATAIGLAAMLVLTGRYPAVYDRHITWIYGLVAAGLCLVAATPPKGRHFRMVFSAALVLPMVAVLGMQAAGLRKVDRTMSQLTTTLEALPPGSAVGLFFGAQRFVPLMEKQGARLDHLEIFGRVSLTSGLVDRAYFDPAYLTDIERVAADARTGLETDPLGWARFLILHRMVRDITPLAAFVLDQAPEKPFFILAYNLDWGRKEDFRYQGLVSEMDRRDCSYTPKQILQGERASLLLWVDCPST